MEYKIKVRLAFNLFSMIRSKIGDARSNPKIRKFVIVINDSISINSYFDVVFKMRPNNYFDAISKIIFNKIFVNAWAPKTHLSTFFQQMIYKLTRF